MTDVNDEMLTDDEMTTSTPEGSPIVAGDGVDGDGTDGTDGDGTDGDGTDGTDGDGTDGQS